MTQAFPFLLTGLSAGAIYAALSLGLVITYRGTGIINFAIGAMGAWSAFVYSDLRTNGTLAFPVVGIPGQVTISGSGVGVVPAILIAGLYGVVAGLGVYLLVFRPIRRASVLAKVVASVGVMLVFQSLTIERFGQTPQVVNPILPASDVRIGSVGIPQYVFWLAGIVVLVTAAAHVWFRSTRTGLAMRAAAGSESTASLAGFSPSMLGAIAWAGSSGIVGFLAVLVAPAVGLNATSYTLYVIPALACALVGRLKGIVPAVAAGLVLGMIDAEITFFSTKSWWPQWAGTGVSDAIPFVAVVIILFLLGKSVPARADGAAARLPRVPRPRLRPGALAVLLGAGVLALVLTEGTTRLGVITSMIMAVIALSVVVLTGLLGQVSLAQAAFAGIGAFALSKFSATLGLGFPWAPLLAALVAAAVGVIAGLPALRIRGIQLAVVTISMAFAFEQVLFSNPSFNGVSGNPVPAPALFGWDLGIQQGSDVARLQFGLLVLVVTGGVALGVINLMRSGTGRRFLAVRSNERASASVGVAVTSTKLTGFALSAFLAGLGGTLLGYSQGSVSPESFTTLVGISWLVFIFVGGITSVGGAFVGGAGVSLGIIYVLIDKFVATSGAMYALISAIGLLVTVIFNPDGVAGEFRRMLAKNRWAGWLGRTRPRAGQPRPLSGTTRGTSAAELDTAAIPPPRTAQRSAQLAVTDLRVRYGGLTAVSNVGLRVASGQIVGLIGANGAGKTTLIDAVSGFTPCEGHVLLSGKALDGRPAHERARSGLARTWQSSELFEDLTVLENLQVAAERGAAVAAVRDFVWPARSDSRRVALQWLDWFGLTEAAGAFPSELSLGQQKLVSLARALGRDPRIVLADEPAAGLSDSETAELARALKRLVDTHDIGVLLVEHDVGLVTGICDYIYVLNFGTLIAEGTPAQVRADSHVIASYLGSEFRAAPPPRDTDSLADMKAGTVPSGEAES